MTTQDELKAERERCAEMAADWFTLSPRYRTKAKLIEMILMDDAERKRDWRNDE